MTALREATLLDIIGVLSGMLETPRGQQEYMQAQLLWASMQPERMASLLFMQSSFTYAMYDEQAPGRALAVAGFISQRKGVYRTWMFALDEAWESYGAALTNHVAEGLKNTLDNAHRIEAVCLNSHSKAQRWYARIGLVKETTLTRYCTDGTDAALFVMTRSEQ